MLNRSSQKKLALSITTAVALFILISSAVRTVYVEGSERVVWQTMSGVSEDLGEPGLHFYFGWTTTPHKYYTGSDTFIIDDKTVSAQNDYMSSKEKAFNQPDAKPVIVPVQMDHLSPAEILAGKTTGPTNITLACVMQFHLQPKSLIDLHNDKTESYRTTFIKEILINELIEQTTVLDARAVYQGSGRVNLQKRIQSQLQNSERFKRYGVEVEKFVIREINIQDQTFLEKIKEEARAEQNRKTAVKNEIAFQAEAKSAKAEALAEQNRRIVEADTKKKERIAKAEGDKQEQILAAEAAAEKVKLAASADAERIKIGAAAQKAKDQLEGEGLKLRKVAEAEGVLALGKAEAAAKKLLLNSYVGEGGQRFAQVEISKAMGSGIEKIYYVPESFSLTAISKDFNNALAIGLPAAKKKAPAPAKAQVKGSSQHAKR
ncbi:MAG: SPFH domain-containing protein [Planctomycetota bacterium]|nr:SPFH domain-containing protein [Planctomycetota bacterium]